jgi:membrane fusion protein, multidrug efflux system
MNSRRLLTLLLAAMLVATLASCSNSSASAAGPSAPAETATASNSAQQPSPAAPSTYVVSGPIVVENQLDVQAQREGVVNRILADTGKRVRKGDLLAELDARQLQADRLALEHQMRASEDQGKFHESEQSVNTADLNRAKSMFDAGLITKEQFEHVKFTRDATVHQINREHEDAERIKAQIRSLDIEIEKTRIMAPFDGVVARRYVRAGQKVASNDRLFWVTAVAPMRIRFTLPQELIRAVATGNTVSVTVPYADDQTHTAKVISVSPVVDPSSGTVEVLAQLIGNTGQIKPGMTATVHIEKHP